MGMKEIKFDEIFENWIKELECKKLVWQVYNRDFTNLKSRIKELFFEDEIEYSLEVSYDCGNNYKVIMRSNKLTDFEYECAKLDEEKLRWAIKDNKNKIIKSCAIHNDIMGVLGLNKEEKK